MLAKITNSETITSTFITLFNILVENVINKGFLFILPFIIPFSILFHRK